MLVLKKQIRTRNTYTFSYLISTQRKRQKANMGDDILVDSTSTLSDAASHNPVTSRSDIVRPVIVIIFLVSLMVYFLLQHKNKSTLPGPRGLPLLGSIHALCRRPITKMKEYSDLYGPIYQLKVGITPLVILNSIEACREACITKSSVFNNRPSFFAKMVGMEAGGIVLLPYDKFHSEQRGIFKRVMKALGSDVFDNLMSIHTRKLKHTLRDSKQSMINLNPHLGDAIFATVGQLIFGADTDVKVIHDLVEGNLTANPVLVLSGKILPLWVKEKLAEYEVDIKTNIQRSLQKTMQMVHERKQNFKSGDFSDLISGYLHVHEEMLSDHHTSEKSGSPFIDDVRSTSEKQLAASMIDCYQAGVEATSAQARWVFYFLARNPHVQLKIQEEMDRVIGKDNTPMLKHRRHHPYALATINEVMRLRPAAPLGAPHANNAPATLFGHRLPEDSVILTNIWAIHMDPNHWESPEEFKPERFLDNKGNLISHESFMPFGLGRRLCPGVEISRNMIFLLMTHVLQGFSFSAAEDTDKGLGNQGINWSPKDYKVIVTPREGNSAQRQ